MATRGANKAKCQGYKMAGTRMKNRLRKLNKHLKIHPNDAPAKAALKLR